MSAPTSGRAGSARASVCPAGLERLDSEAALVGAEAESEAESVSVSCATFLLTSHLTVTSIPFEVRSSRRGEVTILEVAGEIDMSTAPELANAIGSVTRGASLVVVNLSEVVFLDSSALNALVRSQRELAERNISIRVVSPTDRAVRRVFEITHLTESLSVVDSLDEALA